MVGEFSKAGILTLQSLVFLQLGTFKLKFILNNRQKPGKQLTSSSKLKAPMSRRVYLLHRRFDRRCVCFEWYHLFVSDLIDLCVLQITYDLRDLNTEARKALRDSLVELLSVAATGPKVIMVQLCMALADLAIQMPEWQSAVQDMVNKFGGSPELVTVLLEFLTVLPEEMNGNSRLPLSVSPHALLYISPLELMVR